MERLDRVAGLVIEARQVTDTLDRASYGHLRTLIEAVLMQVGSAIARELQADAGSRAGDSAASDRS